MVYCGRSVPTGSIFASSPRFEIEEKGRRNTLGAEGGAGYVLSQ